LSFGHIPRDKKWKNLILKPFGWMNLMRRLQAPIIMRMLDLKRDNVVLDVGCGSGNFSLEIAKKVKWVVGLDLNVRQQHKRISESIPNLTFIKTDAVALPFPEKYFDKILLSSVLQMVEEDSLLLQELHRVLKEDGRLILSVPVGYVYIPKLLNLFLIDYQNFLRVVNEKFGTKTKGYYTLSELFNLFEVTKLKCEYYEYVPHRLGSFVYEVFYFYWSLNFPLIQNLLFIILYPVALLDKLESVKTRGNEIVLSVKKMR